MTTIQVTEIGTDLRDAARMQRTKDLCAVFGDKAVMFSSKSGLENGVPTGHCGVSVRDTSEADVINVLDEKRIPYTKPQSGVLAVALG